MRSISVGLPVFNGERFLRDAVESILAQDFSDFELIISDNASTDGTRDICENYSRWDSRIRYTRLPENLGAARNYNRVFELSSGKYFKWAAHDDRIAPSFLKRCVERLEADPGVAVAFAQMREIDADGRMIRDYDKPIVWNGATAASRIESLLCSPPDRTYIRRCVPITGLFRSDMLRRTRLIGRFGHADKVALVEIAMLGDFAEVPERLFLRRQHAGVSLAANRTAKELANWYDSENRGRIFAPRSRLFVEYGYAIARAPIGAAEKAACVRALLRLLSCDWRIFGGEIKQAIHRAVRLPARTQRPQRVGKSGGVGRVEREMPEDKSIAGAGPSVSLATEVMHTGRLPGVSVIVPTFRDAADLARCLAALRRQTYPAALLQFLFVDNTPEFALAAKAEDYAPARILHEPRPGSYAARNRAIAEASGDVLAFTDADCLPEPGWIAEGVKALADHPGGALIAGGVEVFAVDPARPTATELFELAGAFPQERYAATFRFGVTANVFVTRSVIDRVGPFLDNLASGGDREFGQRVHAAGFPVVYVPQASVRHPARNRLSMLFGKSRRVLRGVYELERRGQLPRGSFLRGFLRDLRPPVQTCWKMLRDPRLGGVVGGLRAAWVMILWRYHRAGYRMRLMLGRE